MAQSWDLRPRISKDIEGHRSDPLPRADIQREPTSDARAEDLLRRERTNHQEARESMRKYDPSVTID